MVARHKRRRKLAVETQQPVAVSTSPHRYFWLIPFAFGGLLAGIVAFGVTYEVMSDANGRFNPLALSLADLVTMPEDQLAKQDVAVMNLLCAKELPGSEDLNVADCLATLDKWAEWVKHETDRHLYKYRQNPAEFDNSEAYYRMLMLITVLQQDFKVHYNSERIRDVDFRRSEDLFIHGMMESGNGGTCVSMPVLYTAVARRLGYPVYLVAAREHVFCRWDSKKDRFNVEATSQGMNSFDDAYYMTWPKPISEAAVKAGHYLQSLPPNEELAMFLAARGHCLEDNGNRAASCVSYAQAAEKAPRRPIYRGFLTQAMGIPSFIDQVARNPRRQPLQPPPQATQPWIPPVQPVSGLPYQVSKPSVEAFPLAPGEVGPATRQPSVIPGFGIQP